MNKQINTFETDEKLLERLHSLLFKAVTVPETPTKEDRAATSKLCQTIKQYTELFANNSSIDCYSMLDEMTYLFARHQYLSTNVISKDDAQELIDAFKDMTYYYKNKSNN